MFHFQCNDLSKVLFSFYDQIRKMELTLELTDFLFEVFDGTDVKLASFSCVQGFSVSEANILTALLFVCAQECE